MDEDHLIERLEHCGYTGPTAEDICWKYAADGNMAGLVAFVLQSERVANVHRA